MKEILLSVIFITYNHEKYVRQALESILCQKTNFKYEIIVSDDCSIDNTQNILKEYIDKYPELIISILRDTNVGANVNFYEAIIQASGKYLITLEGDDYWLGTTKLQRMVNFLNNNLDFFGVSHVREVRNLENKFLGYDIDKKIWDTTFRLEDFLNLKLFSAVSTMYRNFYLYSDDRYRELFTACRNVGDLTMCILLLTFGNIYILSDCWGVYRSRKIKGESNYNSITTFKESYEDHMKILNALKHFFEGNINLKNWYTRWNLSALKYGFKNHDYTYLKSLIKKMSFQEKKDLFLMMPSKIYEVSKRILRTNKKIEVNK